MRAAVLVMLAATPAMADTFGGFSGVDAPYLVNSDRVCRPLEVKDGAATGAPACEKVAADAIAHLSIKEPLAQRGTKAAFAASASGKTLTVKNRAGDVVVTWNAMDPITKVVEVYASQYEDRVAVAYGTRRLGKEVTDVVAFVITKTSGRDAQATPTTPTTPTTPAAPTTQMPEDPALTKAVGAARTADKKKASAAWKAVLAIDAQHSEAQYRLAALAISGKQTADAIAALEKLAASPRGEAIEWLVEARFDSAFAPLRGDARFRAAVGLDRKPATAYEKVMGFGGQWEQTGTSCEKADVAMTLLRDRTAKVRVKSACEGQRIDLPFKGTWRIEGNGVVLTFPTKGQKASAKDEAPCTFERAGDEDALHCTLGRDLEFVALPTRR